MAKLIWKFKLLVLLFGFFSKVVGGAEILRRAEVKSNRIASERDIAINKCIQEYHHQFVQGQNDSNKSINNKSITYQMERRSQYPTGYVHESPDDGFTEFPDPDHVRDREDAIYRFEKLARNKSFRPRPKIGKQIYLFYFISTQDNWYAHFIVHFYSGT